jgi:hypothetical protein
MSNKKVNIEYLFYENIDPHVLENCVFDPHAFVFDPQCCRAEGHMTLGFTS